MPISSNHAKARVDAKIQGSVIDRRRDEQGEIIVTEDGDRRTLYFGKGIMQSTIRIDRPDLLLEDYHEAMMSSLIFNSEPASVLLIGLGGCSLVHFLLKALPDLALDIVEIRKQVIDLAKEYFFLPPEKPNLRIVHASGVDFIEHRASDLRKHDMIIVDAFDESGPAASLLDKDFLSSCRRQLSRSGIFVMNLWNSPEHDFPARYRSIQDAFENNALKLLLSESYRNAVAFGFNDPAMRHHLLDRRFKADDLQGRHGINFPRYLKYLYWQNFDDYDQ